MTLDNTFRCSKWTTLALLCIALTILLQACRDRRESYYPSFADAVKAGEIARGWIPDFLPGSSRAIHIIYDPSSPRTWCSFDFSPGESQRLRQALPSDGTPLPQIGKVGDPGVAWWPDFLKGDINGRRLHENGFDLYVLTEPDVPSGTRQLVFAIDWTKGHGFFCLL
jgi:hypothetical protein